MADSLGIIKFVVVLEYFRATTRVGVGNHDYCNDQRNAAFIIPRYKTLRHQGLNDDLNFSFWHNVFEIVNDVNFM